MTVSSQTSKVSYSGNGSTVAFTVTFYFLADSDIKVLVRSANGTEVVKTLNTDYTVTGAGDPAGGTVTFVTAPISGQTVVLARSVPLTQVTDYTPNDPFPAETHERALDKLTQLSQQINEAVNRSLKLSLSNTMTSTEFTVDAATRANKILGFDASGELSVTQELGTYRGNWSAGTDFVPRDIIKDTSNANIYICLTAHTSTGSQPISSNADVAKWALLVDAATATAAQAAAVAAQAAAEAAQAAAELAETNAETAETNAETAETNAETAETNAEAAQAAAEAARDLTLAAYDSFDDRYLGTKSSNPTVDNDGNTLLDGALYWNTTANEFRVYDLGNTTWSKTVPSAAEQTNIDTVSTNIANVNTVAGISANVTTVAGISANVTTVATNDTNVTTVATNIANVNSVGGNIANVNAVAGNATNINAVNANATNINTVAGINANVTTVAGISANVTTVAGISGNVTSVAGNASNINQVASDTVAINSASANATTATTKAAEALASANAASASAAAASAVALGDEPVRHSVRPSLLLDFANTKTLDPRITFTRASTGTYYDGKTVAKAEENLFRHSQEFDNVAWDKFFGSITANSAVAPDGTTTADTLNPTSQFASVQQSITLIAGQQYTFSVWVKRATGSNAMDLFITNPASSILSFTPTSSWVRYSATFTAAGGGTGFLIQDRNASGWTAWEMWGAQLEQRSSVTAYTATTTARITNYIPALQTAASGVARFEHNPVTGESLGLEIEEQRTNLLTYSEQFDNSPPWGGDNSGGTNPIVTANQAIAPDGTLTADRVQLNRGAGTFSRLQQILSTSSAVHTFSVWMKLHSGTTSANVGIRVNATGVNCVVTNTWQRFTVTDTVATITPNPQILLFSSLGSDATADILVWGAQVEAGSFATSYIPTVASQVTRSADSASMTGTNFSSWFRLNEGSAYIEYIPAVVSGFRNILTTSVGGSRRLFYIGSGNSVRIFDGVTNISGNGTPVVNQPFKAASAYSSAGMAISLNGTTTVTTSSFVGNFTGDGTLLFGTTGTASETASGLYRKVAFYTSRLTNAELQGLTTN
jgi:hypothetical protein